MPSKAHKKIYQPHLSTATDARAVRTREALRTALLRLLESQPLDQITILDIASEAGIGYTTFFRHHPSKESLLNDIAAEQVRNLVGLSAPMMQGTDVRMAAQTLCNYVNEHRSLWTTLLTGGAAAAIREELLRISRQMAALHKQPQGWMPAEVGVVLAVGGIVELLAFWLRQSNPMPSERVAEILDLVVIAPVMSAPRTAQR
jgi:AcrR family transcriptional regulator